MYEIYGQLTLTVACQLVTPCRWQIAQVLQGLGCPQFVKSLPNQCGLTRTMLPCESAMVIAELSKLAR